jgi:fido (protein-threonine AMPylation protein)
MKTLSNKPRRISWLLVLMSFRRLRRRVALISRTSKPSIGIYSATCTSGLGGCERIDISKGGNRFAHHAHIEIAAASIFQKLAKENHLAGLGPDAFSDRAAYYLGELNALHPFREGNGRAQREFISHLAHAKGYYVAWENIAAADLLAASIASFHGDTSELAGFIRRNLSALEQDR